MTIVFTKPALIVLVIAIFFMLGYFIGMIRSKKSKINQTIIKPKIYDVSDNDVLFLMTEHSVSQDTILRLQEAYANWYMQRVIILPDGFDFAFAKVSHDPRRYHGQVKIKEERT